MSDQTGSIIKKVKKSASPIKIWLGGDCCVPRACRIKAKMMIIRVKEVVMIRIAGASVRMVSRIII